VTRPLRIALVGGFGNGNFGNDASLKTALLMIQRRLPGAQVESICDEPSVVTERLGIDATRIARRPTGWLKHLDTALLRIPSGSYNWLRAFWILRRFDALLFPGTGVFDDYRTGPMGFPAQVFRWSVVARLMGRKLLFYGVGAGPIINPVSRFFLRIAAACANYRSYRDSGSKAFMESIGLDEHNSAVIPDIVIGKPTAEAPPVRTAAPFTIGLGVMSYRGWRKDEAIGADYQDKLVRFVRWAEAQGHSVRLLVAEPSDMRAFQRLKQRLGDNIDRGGDEMMVLADVMQAIRSCDLVIASRFHILIAGLKLSRPCISLSYGPKHDLLLAEAGVGEFCQPADYFDFDLLVRHIETIAADPPRYSAIVAERVTAMREQLAAAEDAIVAALLRQPR